MLLFPLCEDMCCVSNKTMGKTRIGIVVIANRTESNILEQFGIVAKNIHNVVSL